MISLPSEEGSSNAQSKANGPAGTPGHHSHFHQWSDGKVSFQATAKYLSSCCSSKTKRPDLWEACWTILLDFQCAALCICTYSSGKLPISNSLPAFHSKMMSLHQKHLSSPLCRAGWAGVQTCSGTQSTMDYSRYSFILRLVCFFSSGFSQSSHAVGTSWILKGARKDLGTQYALAVKGKEVPKPTHSFKICSQCRTLGI